MSRHVPAVPPRSGTLIAAMSGKRAASIRERSSRTRARSEPDRAGIDEPLGQATHRSYQLLTQ
jgi:hypothetical protein